LNIQTERLADHTARVTVEVDSERLNQAKQKAAQRISKQVNIPGFRKGKAPYRILANFVGEQAILDDAVELLSNDIYKEALVESQLDPYGPGALENFNAEPTPALIFVVPLQPEVTLGDYRSVRLEYEKPSVDDEAVNRALRSLQEQQGIVEESHQPTARGNRVTVDMHALIEDEDDEAPAKTEASAEETTEKASGEAGTWEADTHQHGHDEDDKVFLHEHDTTVILDAEHEPMPGFTDALIGAGVGERRAFTLVAPDTEEYTDIAGKNIHFDVVVKKIETMTLPALNDDLAARLTADEEKPLTLLELRMRVRENLENAALERYENDFSNRVLDTMVEGAQLAYPDAMVVDEVEQYLQQMDQSLRQQGLTLQDYMKIYHKTTQDLYDEYRNASEQRVKRSLVMRQVILDENLTVTDDDVNAEIDRIVERFGEDRQASIRKMFAERSMRESVLNDLLRARVQERMVAIAKGEAPELTAAEAEAEAEAETVDTNEVSEEDKQEGETA
jgi:trigger factor